MQHHTFFRNLPPLFIYILLCMRYVVKISWLYIFDKVLSMTSILATLQSQAYNFIFPVYSYFPPMIFVIKFREPRALFNECILNQYSAYFFLQYQTVIPIMNGNQLFFTLIVIEFF